jgi:cation transport ATPase
LKDRIKRADAEIDTLKEEIEGKTSALRELEKRFKGHVSLDELEKRLQKKDADIHEKVQLINGLKEQIRDISITLKEKIAEIQELKQKQKEVITAKEDEISRLEKRINDLQYYAAKAQDAIKETEELKKQIEAVSRDKETALREKAEAEKRLKELKVIPKRKLIAAWIIVISILLVSILNYAVFHYFPDLFTWTIVKEWTEPTTGMEFVLIKGGCYEIGDKFNEGDADEQSEKSVCVDNFYMESRLCGFLGEANIV